MSTKITDRILTLKLKRTKKIKFSARSINYPSFRTVQIPGTNKWMPFPYIMCLLGISPQKLIPIFGVDKNVPKQEIEVTYDDLDAIPLDQAPFKKLAEVLNKTIEVEYDNEQLGRHLPVFTVNPD